MYRTFPIALVALIMGLNASAVQAKPTGSKAITAAIADSDRPDADKDRDAARKPAETLALAGIKPGQKIADLYPGTGYFTRIFSKVVGSKGHVYAVWPIGAPEKMTADAKAIAANPAYPNVSEGEQSFNTLKFPVPLDVVWTSQNYHDIHNIKDVDMAAVDRAIFDALKPGGTFIVLDHVAPAGSGFQDTNTLHRIDPEAVKTEVEAAGFVLVKQSDFLKNPDDPHTAKVFDPSIRGKTDQFFFKFVKPKK
jgi:predicted methyltransferase